MRPRGICLAYSRSIYNLLEELSDLLEERRLVLEEYELAQSSAQRGRGSGRAKTHRHAYEMGAARPVRSPEPPAGPLTHE